MDRHCARGLAAAYLLAIASVACRSAAPAATPVPSPTSAAAASPAGGEAAAVARARADSVRRPYTEADVHFMSAMIGHHAQAIVMSRMAPTHGASATVVSLADRIVNAQSDEIRTMQRWLADRGRPVPEPDTAGTAVHAGMEMGPAGSMGSHHHAMAMDGAPMMPGMLTPEQLRQLDAARGTDFDRLFLRFMIQHHRGAVSMIKQLFASYGAAQDETVFKFASDVNVDQTTEIARMERMLAAILFERPAP